MKKTYETPVLTTEAFDAQDVITASAPIDPIQGLLDTVGGFMENMLDMFGSMGH